jgi:hypothetical protein
LSFAYKNPCIRYHSFVDGLLKQKFCAFLFVMNLHSSSLFNAHELRKAIAVLAVFFASNMFLTACSTPQPAIQSVPKEEKKAEITVQEAARILGEWQKKDAKLTQKLLQEQGIFVADQQTLQALAASSATAPSTSPSAIAQAPAIQAEPVVEIEPPAPVPIKPIATKPTSAPLH